MKVNYDFELLKTIYGLSNITEKILIQKTDAGIEIKAGDDGRMIMYHLTAPSDMLSIESDCAFYDYTRFFNKVSMFEDPELTLDDCLFTIKSDGKVATHNIASGSIVKSAFNSVNIPSVDATVVLTADAIKNINKLSGINYFESNRIGFEFGSDKSTFTLKSTNHSNTYQSDLEGVEFKTDGNFDLELDSKVFQMLPPADYELRVCKDGIVEFAMKRNDNISIMLYAAKVV